MSDGIRVKVLPEEEIDQRYYLPSKKELRMLFQDIGFLPPDAQELSRVGHEMFAATPEGRLAVPYAVFYLGKDKLRPRLFRAFLEEEGGVFYSNKRFESDDFPITGLPPRNAKSSSTVVLTSGLENLLATYVMTEKSYIFAVPHAGFALRNSNTLSRFLRDGEAKKVVLAFPESQRQYQSKLAKFLRQSGFEVEELSYEGRSPYEHYQISVSKMLEQAMQEYDNLIPDNGV